MTLKRTQNDSRRDHNRDLIRRMRNGESLTSFDSSASWFPPRPIIKKDANAVGRLYGSDVKRVVGPTDEQVDGGVETHVAAAKLRVVDDQNSSDQ